MSGYVPELGQAVFGVTWAEHRVSEIGSAGLAYLLREMERVFWNREQRAISYQDESDAETWNAYGSPIEWHAYWWGDDDASEVGRPNLTFDGVEIRWYKYPGRGESVDRVMSPDAWSEWLTKALAAARAADPTLQELVAKASTS